MFSPAERFAAARHRQRERTRYRKLAEFAGGYDFGLDAFQVDACQALEDGEGVLVAAPTGAGKTVVGEFAVHLALAEGRKCFYTTPIKALSNQKYADLTARHGARNVGLLTGDNAINGNAPVVVMTTEVLRNMLYARSPALRDLGYVVMDEVHYLADRSRGAVWEEVIIHLPAAVRLVSLSATVSNAEEFAQWLVTVRGHTRVVVEERRPVPLWPHVLAGSRLFDLFADSGTQDRQPDGTTPTERPQRVNPELLRLAQEESRLARTGTGRPGQQAARQDSHRPPPSRIRVPSRAEVIERLDRAGLLPAITFIFSRAGCEAAVGQCLRSGLRLTTAAERGQIRTHVAARTADLPPEDRAILGYGEWLDGLERGLAAHHAGMLPTFKEVVEELFVRGLIKAVFATETLALGINMPARTVVLERLVKWNGDAHVNVTPGEYTQLTGRAGRRGIDVEGHAVVLWTPGFDPKDVAGLASIRTYPLRSSFQPSYNMAVNLVQTSSREHARTLLESSFAQFQADRAVVGLARQVARNVDALAGYAEAMTCHLGEFASYAALRQALRDREAYVARAGASARRADAAESLGRLRRGDVIRVPAGRRSGLAVVLDPGRTEDPGDPRPTVLTVDRQVKRLASADFPTVVAALGSVRIPKTFNPRSPQSRRDLAASLRTIELPEGERGPLRRSSATDDLEIARVRAALRRHPCHGCAEREDHARWSERYARLSRDTDILRRRVEGRTNTIARTFDRVCALLDSLGYLAGETVPPAGQLLAGIYAESDLLVAECLRAGVFDGLSAPELAGCASALVYEARRTDDAVPRVPGGRSREALAAMARLWGQLSEAESAHRLDFLREPDLGFVWPAYRWAGGAGLDVVLTEADLTAGDFVRAIRQLLDLLDQIGKVADAPVAAAARAAGVALRRGVVAYSSVG
ncbi:MAG: DEAD/DEAH box helicase [Frankiaceae bacterium]